jgi:NAD(P)-dependent dehydrogenase (short-subunit alcohol dehydrogenase family)
MDKVWLVTGSASGLGRNIAEAVLESGDRLVATARDPRRLDDLVNKFGERVRAVSLSAYTRPFISPDLWQLTTQLHSGVAPIFIASLQATVTNQQEFKQIQFSDHTPCRPSRRHAW